MDKGAKPGKQKEKPANQIGQIAQQVAGHAQTIKEREEEKKKKRKQPEIIPQHH